MREQKSGIIVNISSGNGRIGFPGATAYVSTKFAVEGLSESMTYELEPFGIKAVLVEPWFIRTDVVNAMDVAKKSQDPNSPYSQIMQKMTTSFEHMKENWSSPDLVAKVVLKAVASENPSLRYISGKALDEQFYNMMKQNFMK
jgi:NAD(P)-dependent dehydrogenase (short-subunit alcohol dehydrogenase family)